MIKSHDLFNSIWSIADLLRGPYRFTQPCPLSEVDADLKRAEAETMRLASDVTQGTRA